MKESGLSPSKTDITNSNIQEMVIQTADMSSSEEATQRNISILDITFKRTVIEKVMSSATKLNPEEIKLILGALNEFAGFFDVTIGKLFTPPVDI